MTHMANSISTHYLPGHPLYIHSLNFMVLLPLFCLCSSPLFYGIVK